MNTRPLLSMQGGSPSSDNTILSDLYRPETGDQRSGRSNISSRKTGTHASDVDRLHSLFGSLPQVSSLQSEGSIVGSLRETGSFLTERSNLTRYAEVDPKLEQIRTYIGQMQSMQQVYSTSTSFNERKDCVAQIDQAIILCTRLGRQVKKCLMDFSRDDELFSQQNNHQVAMQQIRENMQRQYLRNFQILMEDFRTVSEDFRTLTRGRLRRELKVVDPTLGDSQIEELLNSGQTLQVLERTYVTQSLQKAMDEMEERRNEMLKLEQSVVEMLELFEELELLVDLQQEKFDIIEQNIATAAAYVQRGEDYAEQALEVRKQSHRRRLCRKHVKYLLLMLAVTGILLLCMWGLGYFD